MTARPPRWRLYLSLGRVSNLPTVWSNTLAGILLSQGDAKAAVDPLGALVLAVAMSLFYVGGMFLNDAFDRGIDARERPTRPIPAGWIKSGEVFTIGFALLAAGAMVVAVHGAWLGGRGGVAAMAGAVSLAATIVAYDLWHKGNPVSPLLMGACRVLVYVTAALAASGHVAGQVWLGAAMLLSYLMGLTYVAKQENLTEFRNLWPLVLLFVPFALLLGKGWTGALSALLFAALLGWVVFAVSLLRKKGRGVIPRVVVSLIAGISLLDALLISVHGNSSWALAAAAAFGATLFLQRYVSGT